ncbi:unnamed protein product [Nyctereutes procyonoides]|uniref:phosphoglycerate mutase (2,3-diphosphoglycerate-dependent) n=1 Tax=Nyctereutes procyonoides TaxID=34880 RepID=A0A811XZB7_NYCPR|nr:unnamed protein product [Nyctereutes procyonoides]
MKTHTNCGWSRPELVIPSFLPGAGSEFDTCFTSVQRRAIWTLGTVLDATDQMWLPIVRTWTETAAKHGKALVKSWRCLCDDLKVADLTEGQLPSCESLHDMIAGVLPFWNEDIASQVKEGKRVLIAAYGNLLQGIVRHLEARELEENVKVVKPTQFRGDEESACKATEAVAAQGKANKGRQVGRLFPKNTLPAHPIPLNFLPAHVTLTTSVGILSFSGK